MSLVVCTWGGTIWDNTEGGSAVEEWSNTVSFDGTLPDLAASLADVKTAIQTWFTAATTRIHGTVSLDWVKLNQYDYVTGHQITDPTIMATNTPGSVRGGYSGVTMPFGTSYRISLDNGTRNRRSRGGFYVPRTSALVENNGRFGTAQINSMVSSADTMLEALQTELGMTLVVWSRAEGLGFPVTRLRVGNVPDNISRRRNDLREIYTSADI